MTIEPSKRGREVEHYVERPFIAHAAIDTTLINGLIYGPEALERVDMHQGDAVICWGALDTAGLTTEANEWAAERLHIAASPYDMRRQRNPVVPSRKVVIDNLDHGETISGLVVAARLTEGRAVVRGHTEAARNMGNSALALLGGKRVTAAELALHEKVNAINIAKYGTGAHRNVGPQAAPYLWANAIDHLRDLFRYKIHGAERLLVPLTVGLEQSLAHAKSLHYPPEFRTMAFLAAESRRCAFNGLLSRDVVAEVRQAATSLEQLEAGLRAAKLKRQLDYLKESLIDGQGFVPHQRRSGW